MKRLDDKYHIVINQFIENDEVDLFNAASFFQLHAGENDQYIQLINVNKKVCATICFYEADEKGIFVSPKRGTFGGLSVYEKLDLEVVERFLNHAIELIRERSANEIRIKCAPFSHNLAISSLVTNILMRNNFSVGNFELNYHIDVNADGFLNRISYGNRKRIKKCLNAGMTTQYHSHSDIDSIYQVIKLNRERRGFPVTMSFEQVKTMLDKFPDRYHLFSVKNNIDEGEMVASALCISLTPSVLYVFYWGDVAGYEKYSPIALLASSIYEYCQNNNFEQLDIGTATVDNVPNYGLAQFKRNLGFSESLKPELVWN